jgi:membrane protein DedA with SNARE-associated domain
VLDVFDKLVELVSDAWWTYPLIFAVAMLDGFFPIVPSETMAITGGVLAGSGDLSLPLVILAASAGAIAGDNIAYFLGQWVGEHTLKRWFRSEKSVRRLEWAERQLDERGGYLIVVARFIPGGRVAVNFSAGYVPTFPWHRFIRYDVLAGVIWGTYTGLLGYVGGKQFEDQPWKGLLIAFLVAIGLAGAVEVVRHLRSRRGGAVLAPEQSPAADPPPAGDGPAAT